MKNNNSGTYLKVSEDVVVKVAEMAALEIDGVSGIGSEFCGFCKGVKVKNTGGVVDINIAIIVNVSVGVEGVAERVQLAVKDSVQSMTGIPVSRVCVKVTGFENSDTV